MKLLVFAHKPPPHHGQSYMVQFMIEGLGGDARRAAPGALGASSPIRCYHVDARVSRAVDDIGRARGGKVFLLFKYCLEAIWCRFRFGVRNFYYVPAPGQRVPLYRDWLVMALCRPFFNRLVFHTHAVGLGGWLETQAQGWERALSRFLLGRVDLNIVLSSSYERDASVLAPRKIIVVPIGIPDPCPQFEQMVLPQRGARLAARRRLLSGKPGTAEEAAAAGAEPDVLRVLYVSLCSREKGLFDAVEGVCLLHQKFLAGRTPMRVQLSVVGKFLVEAERLEFEKRIAQPDLQFKGEPLVRYHGFVDTETKHRLLRESDCFCFPTYYPVEGQPASLVEAMALGLPIVTTYWRAIPELFPKDYPGLVKPKAPAEVAAGLERVSQEDYALLFRRTFLDRFTEKGFIERISVALQQLDA